MAITVEDPRAFFARWLKHNREEASRRFNEDLKALGNAAAAKGLYYSGSRIKDTIKLTASAVKVFAELAFGQVSALPEVGDGLAMATEAATTLAKDFIRHIEVLFERDGVAPPDRSHSIWKEIHQRTETILKDLNLAASLAAIAQARLPHTTAFDAFAARDAFYTRHAGSWLKLRQAHAWVVFRSEEAIEGCRNGIPEDALDRFGPPVSTYESLVQALIERRLVSYGYVYQKGFLPIPAEAWIPRQEISLSEGPLDDFLDIVFAKADLLAVFPPVERRCPASVSEPGPAAPPVVTGDALRPLSEDALNRWWKSVESKRDSLTQDELLELCRARHRKHFISRARIRLLTGPRLRGKRPFRGNPPAK